MDSIDIIILTIIIGIVFFIISSIIVMNYIIYRLAFYYDNDPSFEFLDSPSVQPYREGIIKYIKDAASLPCEKVWTKSFDSLNLCARLYVKDPKAPFDILFHGYKSGSIKDFSGGINLSLNNGHNVLLVDQRAHGDSEGHIISFGLNERFDVLSWVNYLIERYGNDILIGLYGISMGAATVIMASELDLPKNVKLVVADCPFSSAEDIIVKVTNETPCPLFLLKMFLPISAKLLGKFNIHASSAVKAAKNAKVPILLIHGKGDDFVPFSMSEKIKGNNDRVEFHPFDCNVHGLSYIFEPEKYEQLVKEFNDKYLH